MLKEIVKNMGWRYVRFRGLYEIKRKTGVLKNKFPTNPELKRFIALEDWRKSTPKFFFENKESLQFSKDKNPALKTIFQDYKKGKIQFFNAFYLDTGKDYNWIKNPDSNYEYNINNHWTEVEDFSQEKGDIKYVWEKSRFSFLHHIIRYDFHFEEDCSELVFDEINSWINANPINQGPNYKCSQEISLRVLNWTFALNYYKNSSHLSEALFEKIMHHIYWQINHVYHNIHFSRIAVRNNHAVTETLMLYLSGLLFPFFPNVEKWKRKGKAWFEEEIAYQVYEDGTFLQFSHNYHRVLIQLLTWAFVLAEKHGEQFTELTYTRAKKSLNYLYQCQDDNSGHLPNYGSNDGALFFKMNNREYRDYRPQLNALYYYFNRNHFVDQPELQEDVNWLFGDLASKQKKEKTWSKSAINSFNAGGIYTMRDQDTFTFVKCGSYKDRPAHADNLHVDIWYKGQNILRDAGTYKYNTTAELSNYFTGTKSHNSVVLGEHVQMKKGPRFIWFDWSKAIEATISETKEYFLFKGKIQAFQHVGEQIFHTRTIKKFKDRAEWEIEDVLKHDTDLPMIQVWNPAPDFDKQFSIEAIDDAGNKLAKKYGQAYYSSLYGVKEEAQNIQFSTTTHTIKTRIKEI